jgi:prolyl oligopeptidase
VAVTDHRVVAVIYDNVRGGLASFIDRGEWGWKSEPLPVIDNASVSIVAHGGRGRRRVLQRRGLHHPDPAEAGRRTRSASRSDGQIPARPVRRLQAGGRAEGGDLQGRDRDPLLPDPPKGQKLDGLNPTLLHAYGGFNLSKLPVYDPLIGKLWLERGGSYAVANIRGGGEFGPAGTRRR